MERDKTRQVRRRKTPTRAGSAGVTGLSLQAPSPPQLVFRASLHLFSYYNGHNTGSDTRPSHSNTCLVCNDDALTQSRGISDASHRPHQQLLTLLTIPDYSVRYILLNIRLLTVVIGSLTAPKMLEHRQIALIPWTFSPSIRLWSLCKGAAHQRSS
jgi:hypothetical protein